MSGGRGSGRSPRLQELVRFGVTGGAAYASDVVVFNLLLLSAGMPSAWAKVLSSAVAIAVAFAGSRYYTWSERRSSRPGREYLLFLAFSVAAAGIQLACLLVSRHLLGLTSPLADNVSANLVGMALATLFRFWTFRTYVFPPPVAPEGDAGAEPAGRERAGREPAGREPVEQAEPR